MNQTRDMSCEQVRQQAYRYRRGDLIGAETAAIDAHLDGCATCQDYYERLGILLESASEWDTSDASSEPDDLFAGIAARIEQAETTEAPEAPDVEPTEDVGEADKDVAYDIGSRGWVPAVVGLAAGVLLTLGVIYVVGQTDAPGGAEQPVHATVQQDGEQAGKADEETSQAVELARKESESSQVEVFASDNAKWALTGDEELVLEVERGSLLVEFVPDSSQTLRVDAPDFSVQVVGTVFYVSADEDGPKAGVLAGRVEVEPRGGKPSVLTAEQEVGADFEPRSMPKARVVALSRYVDPKEHMAKLDKLERTEDGTAEKRAARSAKRADTGAQKAAKPQHDKVEKTRRLPPDLERLRSRAEQATRQGQYHDAVRYYRSLLERLPPVHPIAASVHLDLAHIYLHRLNSPGRAAPYLRTFIERWPADVAAATARRELCKIAEQTGEAEPGCEVQP